MKTFRWLLVLALLGTAAASADVYRSTDAKGTVVYSDRPSENSEPVIVTTSKPGRPGNPIAPRDTKAASGAPNDAATQASAPGAQAQAGQKQKGDITPAEKEAERAKNCQTARERKTKYDQSHRLFKLAPNGDREYLSDAEIDTARTQAAADVQTWCGG